MSIIAVLGAHWGDEGKGNIAAALASSADICARFQGGPNAGHTVLHEGREYVFRSVPAGVVSGAVALIGGGCVVDPQRLLNEIAWLRGIVPSIHEQLIISPRAHVITPTHVAEDACGGGKIGTTRTGVGPAYRDKAARVGIRVAQLHPGNADLPNNLRSIAEQFADELGPCVQNDQDFVRSALDRGARVVAEGAQGARLDLDHGDYPFVTSSCTTIGAVLTGLGVGPRDIAASLIVTPAYVTKVGGGALPSRVEDSLNAELRQRGHELDGATGLMRDTGWLDLAWLRRACRLNQADRLVVTKLDVLAGMPQIGVFDADAARPVALHPGWSLDDVATGSPRGAAMRYLGEIERAAGVPIVAASHGPGSHDCHWFEPIDDLWIGRTWPAGESSRRHE